MTSMGWGLFPWPVLFVISMIAMAVFMAVRRSQHSGARGPGCGFVAPASATLAPVVRPPTADPLIVLRDRFARGEIDLAEIDLAELEARVEGLLRFDPNESISWQDQPAAAASSRRPR